MALISNARWQLNPISRLHWLAWDAQYIVYNAASGQTHILNELGAAILRLLETEVWSGRELGERLVAGYEGLALDSDLQAAIDAMLTNLDTLGLIEPIAL